MTLAIVLSRKGLAANRANKWSFIGVGAKVRPEVVSTRETFGAKAALECSRVLLHSFRPGLLALLWFGQAQSKDVVGNGGR